MLQIDKCTSRSTPACWQARTTRAVASRKVATRSASALTGKGLEVSMATSAPSRALVRPTSVQIYTGSTRQSNDVISSLASGPGGGAASGTGGADDGDLHKGSLTGSGSRPAAWSMRVRVALSRPAARSAIEVPANEARQASSARDIARLIEHRPDARIRDFWSTNAPWHRISLHWNKGAALPNAETTSSRLTLAAGWDKRNPPEAPATDATMPAAASFCRCLFR